MLVQFRVVLYFESNLRHRFTTFFFPFCLSEHVGVHN